MISAAPTPIAARTAITWFGGVGDQGAEAGEPEDRDADLERALAPEAVAERAEDEQQPCEDEQVGVDHPLQLRRGSVELVLQRRQGDVENRVVEPDDHQAQRQHAERLPTARVMNGIDRHQAALLVGANEGRALGARRVGRDAERAEPALAEQPVRPVGADVEPVGDEGVGGGGQRLRSRRRRSRRRRAASSGRRPAQPPRASDRPARSSAMQAPTTDEGDAAGAATWIRRVGSWPSLGVLSRRVGCERSARPAPRSPRPGARCRAR